MTSDGRTPARFGDMVDAALAAWAARWPFYVAVAAASMLVQFAATAIDPGNPLTIVLTNAIANAYPTAVASIDVAARVTSEREPPLPVLLRAAAVRTPGVAIILMLVNLVEGLFVAPTVFGGPDATWYGALVLPGLAIMGILALPASIASIDTSFPLAALPAFSLLRGFVLGTIWPNLGLLCAGGAMLAVPDMAGDILKRAFLAHGVSEAMATFWAYIPVDALVTVPFAAFFTYLYLDFASREARR